VLRHAFLQRPRAIARGVTLIELMVTLVVFGLLLGLAMPVFTTWIRNSQIRAVAEGLQNGLRVAQAESLRRNRTVVFSLTNAQPGLNATAVANGRNWAVQYVPIAMDTPVAPDPFIQGGTLGEASTTVTVSSGGVTGVCFNSAGRIIAGTAATTSVPGAVCNAGQAIFIVTQPSGADIRPLRVTVDIGGRVRMCDPNRPSTAPDGC